MKKILFLLVLFPMMAISQTVTQNFIKTTTYKIPTQTAIPTPTITQANQNVTYFDGLGRPVQQVAHQQSGTGKDIVTPIEYDTFGRQVKDYLPYVPTAAASLDYKTTALTEVGTFYNTATYENTTNPFSQKEFEASPLNRVLKQAAPGEDWKLGNGHEIRLDYQANTNADLVRRFGVSFIGGNTENPYLEDNGIYDPSQLYKTITKDENWQTSQTNPKDHTTEEFKDKEGRVILKRAFDAGKWLDTYYVYDDYGNLTYVLPPKVFTYQSITQGYIDTVLYLDDMSIFSIENYTEMWVSFNENSLNISFQSQIFDSGAILKSGKIADLNMSPSLPDMPLGNIVCRNSSGQATIRGTASILNGAVYFSVSGEGVYDQEYGVNSLTLTFKTDITAYQSNFTPALLDRSTLNDLIYQYRYDKRNRLIEKKLPGKEWEFIVYDKLDRSILTQDANLRTSKKWLFTKYDVFNRPVYTGEYINTVKTTRADVQLLADTGTTLSETNQESNNINSTDLYYSNNAFPNGRDINLLTINYYDNYNFDLNGGVSATSYTITPITNAKGLVTGNKVRILGTADWITSLTYYDAKSRPVYSYSKNNYLAITSTVKRQFDFVGKTLETTSTHLRNGVTTSIVDIFTYDQAGRLTKQTQAINGATTPEVIVANTYDELGQLSGKKVGGKTIQGLQTIDYAYNIRGWLKNINNPDNLGQDLFGFKINYNTMNPSLPANYQDIRPLYNGNINSTSWKTNRINTLKEYCYTYDALNRFKNAYYAEDNVFNDKFNEGIPKYDRNGNIETLHRFMQDPGQSTYSKLVDILDYQYNNGNLLLKVTDVQKDSFRGELGFKDGTNTDDDYTYDANGNMILDKNKGITAIVYNHLNLPTKITFGSGTIEYKYDATGIKQRKIVSGGTTTDYAGGFQYENNVLKFFPQPEGYVEYNSGIFSYIYQYKDQLGNVRLSYRDSNNDGIIATSEILEENNYFPFGLKHNNSNNVVNSTNPALKYKFQGQELQDELGLGWYSYKWRNYDPAIGRFMCIDPLTEKYEDYTPYQFSSNQPVHAKELEGLESSNDLNKKTPTQRAYNPKTGNTDLAVLVVETISDVIQSINTYTTTTDKEVTSTAISKNGGGENQKSTGKKTGDNISADAFLTGAPGSASKGNNLAKTKDFIKAVKDINSMFKKGQKVGDGVNEVIKENSKGGETKPEKTEYVQTVSDPKNSNNNEYVRKDVYDAQQKRK